MKYLKSLSIAATLAASIAIPASADTELTMYYPIAVGGSLTQVVDGIVADFEAENPDIKVNAVYSGNYDVGQLWTFLLLFRETRYFESF